MADNRVDAIVPTLSGRQNSDSSLRSSSDLERKELKLRTDDEKQPSSHEHAAYGEEDADVTASVVAPVAMPWRYKWLALLVIVLLPIGNTWADSSMSPLKATLRRELKISNTDYGVIDSAGNIVNSVWPIIGGLALDWYGVNLGLLACTGVIFVGACLSAIACNISNWRLMAGGKILQGFGDAVLDSAQRKLLYHYFGSKGLAFAGGLELSVYRAISLIAGSTAVPISEGTGWYGWAFWIPAMWCLVSVMITIGYVIFDAKFVPKSIRLTSNKAAAKLARDHVAKKRFNLSAYWLLPWAFWMLPSTMVMQSAAAGAFGGISPDLIRMKGYTEAVAAFTANARQLIPLFLLPFVGLGIDRFGHRFHLIAFAPLLWILSYSLIGFTSVHPLVPVVFVSFCNLIQAFPIQATIPLLVRDQTKLGTAFGVYRAFNNAGSAIMDVVIGRLQDSTEDMAYTKVLYLVISLKALAFVLGLGYLFADFKYLGRGMTMSERARVEQESQIENPEDDPLTRRTVSKVWTWYGTGILFAMVVTGWVIFIYYLL
ncbi:hypothetical protein OIO90_003564 [Microbotryomycetes sp. JL221]|nr:hypothetical protein OIO90_003564 [Microbotryomycetes sp. JL221]